MMSGVKDRTAVSTFFFLVGTLLVIFGLGVAIVAYLEAAGIIETGAMIWARLNLILAAAMACVVGMLMLAVGLLGRWQNHADRRVV